MEHTLHLHLAGLKTDSDNHSLHGLASLPGPCQKVGEGMGMGLHMVHTPLRQTLSVFCSLGLQWTRHLCQRHSQLLLVAEHPMVDNKRS